MTGKELNSNRWIIGISGASGTVYARRLLSSLSEHVPDIQLHVVVSEGAQRVLKEEEDIAFSGRTGSAKELIGKDAPNITVHNCKDTGASIASGSFPCAGMVIVPCSMTTLAAIAHGFADNLLRRAADVTLKEERKLIIVPRETPLSPIHLENLLKLSRMGVTVLPAMPGFYMKPQTIDDLVNSLVMRIADRMGIDLPLSGRWGLD